MEESIVLRLPAALAAAFRAQLSRGPVQEEICHARAHQGTAGEQMDYIWGAFEFPYMQPEDGLSLFGGEGEGATSAPAPQLLPGSDPIIPAEYWQEQGADYFFKFGDDVYYASLVTLPTRAEIHETKDQVHTIKTADIRGMLLVHDVTVASGLPRPTSSSDQAYPHGVCGSLEGVVPNRFERASAEARRNREQLTLADIQEADKLLLHYTSKIIQSHKKTRVAGGEGGSTPKGGKRVKGATKPKLPAQPIEYTMEQEIEGEPWMEFAGSVFTIYQGSDEFQSSWHQVMKLAMNARDKLEQEQRRRAELISRCKTTTMPYRAVVLH